MVEHSALSDHHRLTVFSTAETCYTMVKGVFEDDCSFKVSICKNEALTVAEVDAMFTAMLSGLRALRKLAASIL